MFGLQFIAVNFLYLLFSLIVGIVIYVILSKKEKFTRPKRFGISVGTFLVVWMLPFWDLLLQKAIKTYYETFKMESEIYAYPEKDKDGKIESLGVGESNWNPLSSFIEPDHTQKVTFDTLELNLMKVSDKDISNWYGGKYIKNFIEIGVYDDNYKIKLFRINKQTTPVSMLPIEQQIARYQIKASESYCFFELCKKREYVFKDIKSNKVLARAFHLNFPLIKNEFRNKYLLFRGPSGIPLGLDSVGNDEETFEKLFGFFMRISGLDKKNKNQGDNK